MVSFNLKKNIIFPIFHGQKNTQFKNLSYFGKLQILGCYTQSGYLDRMFLLESSSIAFPLEIDHDTIYLSTFTSIKVFLAFAPVIM